MRYIISLTLMFISGAVTMSLVLPSSSRQHTCANTRLSNPKRLTRQQSSNPSTTALQCSYFFFIHPSLSLSLWRYNVCRRMLFIQQHNNNITDALLLSISLSFARQRQKPVFSYSFPVVSPDLILHSPLASSFYLHTSVLDLSRFLLSLLWFTNAYSHSLNFHIGPIYLIYYPSLSLDSNFLLPLLIYLFYYPYFLFIYPS